MPMATVDGWVIPNEVSFSAFGDTDGDGDVDMVGLVCGDGPAGNGTGNATIKAFENVAGNVSGTVPSWENPKVILTFDTPCKWVGYEYGVATEARETLYENPGFVTLVDIDEDDDLDLIMSFDGLTGRSVDMGGGDLVGPSFVLFYKNDGNSTDANWVNSTAWKWVPSNINGETSRALATALSFADMDLDGDLDVIALTITKCSYYENTGNNTLPVYKCLANIIEQDSNGGIINSDHSNGVGSYAANGGIALGDIDNDGDIDLMIGSAVYENTGSRKEMAWTKTERYKWLGMVKPDDSTSPADLPTIQQIIDLDLDGLDDFVFKGRTTSSLMLYKRIKVLEDGTHRFKLRTTWALSDVQVGLIASPVGVDLNGDGRNDLVVGTGERSIEDARYPNFDAGLKMFEHLRIGKNGVEYPLGGTDWSLKRGGGKDSLKYRTTTIHSKAGCETTPTNEQCMMPKLQLGFYTLKNTSNTLTQFQVLSFADANCTISPPSAWEYDNMLYPCEICVPFEGRPGFFKVENDHTANGKIKVTAFTDANCTTFFDSIHGITSMTMDGTCTQEPLIFQGTCAPGFDDVSLMDTSGSRIRDTTNDPAHSAVDIPAFIDIDRDGDFDLIVGSYQGGLRFFNNTGSSNSWKVRFCFLGFLWIFLFLFFVVLLADVSYHYILV